MLIIWEKKLPITYGKKGRRARVSGIWKLIWSLNLPNAAKMFLWRACQNILPTKKNLLKRCIVKEPSYPICGIDGGSLPHIFGAAHLRWMYGEPLDNIS
jgi:hypothetical protein